MGRDAPPLLPSPGPGPPRKTRESRDAVLRRWAWRMFFAALFISFVLTGVVTGVVAVREKQAAVVLLQTYARSLAGTLRAALVDGVNSLATVAVAIASDRDWRHRDAALTHAATHLVRDSTGALLESFALAQYVNSSGRAAWESDMVYFWGTPSPIQALLPNGTLVVSSPKEAYLPYRAFADLNSSKAFGARSFDFLSEPQRASSVELAKEVNQMVITPHVTRVTDGRTVFLSVFPIFRKLNESAPCPNEEEICEVPEPGTKPDPGFYAFDGAITSTLNYHPLMTRLLETENRLEGVALEELGAFPSLGQGSAFAPVNWTQYFFNLTASSSSQGPPQLSILTGGLESLTSHLEDVIADRTYVDTVGQRVDSYAHVGPLFSDTHAAQGHFDTTLGGRVVYSVFRTLPAGGTAPGLDVDTDPHPAYAQALNDHITKLSQVSSGLHNVFYFIAGARIWRFHILVATSAVDPFPESAVITVATGIVASFIIAALAGVAAAAIAERERAHIRSMEHMAELVAVARDSHEVTMQYTCHQLRNPLHRLIGSLSLIEDAKEIAELEGREFVMREDQNRDLRNIATCATELSRLISDITDLTTLSSGKMTVTLSAIPVRLACEAAIRALASARFPHAYPVRVDMHVDSGVPEFAVSDILRVQQLLGVALTNAAQHGCRTSTRRTETGELPHVEIKFDVFLGWLPRRLKRGMGGSSAGRGMKGIGGMLVKKRSVASLSGLAVTGNGSAGKGSGNRLVDSAQAPPAAAGHVGPEQEGQKSKKDVAAASPRGGGGDGGDAEEEEEDTQADRSSTDSDSDSDRTIERRAQDAVGIEDDDNSPGGTDELVAGPHESARNASSSVFGDTRGGSSSKSGSSTSTSSGSSRSSKRGGTKRSRPDAIIFRVQNVSRKGLDGRTMAQLFAPFTTMAVAMSRAGAGAAVAGEGNPFGGLGPLRSGESSSSTGSVSITPTPAPGAAGSGAGTTGNSGGSHLHLRGGAGEEDGREGRQDDSNTTRIQISNAPTPTPTAKGSNAARTGGGGGGGGVGGGGTPAGGASNIARQALGVGLGLPLAHSIAKRLGGSLRIFDTPYVPPTPTNAPPPALHRSTASPASPAASPPVPHTSRPLILTTLEFALPIVPPPQLLRAVSPSQRRLATFAAEPVALPTLAPGGAGGNGTGPLLPPASSASSFPPSSPYGIDDRPFSPTVATFRFNVDTGKESANLHTGSSQEQHHTGEGRETRTASRSPSSSPSGKGSGVGGGGSLGGAPTSLTPSQDERGGRHSTSSVPGAHTTSSSGGAATTAGVAAAATGGGDVDVVDTFLSSGGGPSAPSPHVDGPAMTSVSTGTTTAATHSASPSTAVTPSGPARTTPSLTSQQAMQQQRLLLQGGSPFTLTSPASPASASLGLAAAGAASKEAALAARAMAAPLALPYPQAQAQTQQQQQQAGPPLPHIASDAKPHLPPLDATFSVAGGNDTIVVTVVSPHGAPSSAAGTATAQPSPLRSESTRIGFGERIAAAAAAAAAATADPAIAPSALAIGDGTSEAAQHHPSQIPPEEKQPLVQVSAPVQRGVLSSTFPAPLVHSAAPHSWTVTEATVGTPDGSPAAFTSSASAIASGSGTHPIASGSGTHLAPPHRRDLHLRVLVVDDEEGNRRLLSRMLARLGCTCDTLEDGDMLEARLRACGQLPPPPPGEMGSVGSPVDSVPLPGAVSSAPPSPVAGADSTIASGAGSSFFIAAPRYDIILLDIVMARSDGAEVCRRLVRDLGLTVPVVAATGNAERGLADFGFTDIMQKPFSVEKLYTVLRRVTRLSSQGESAEEVEEGKGATGQGKSDER